MAEVAGGQLRNTDDKTCFYKRRFTATNRYHLTPQMISLYPHPFPSSICWKFSGSTATHKWAISNSLSKNDVLTSLTVTVLETSCGYYKTLSVNLTAQLQMKLFV